jgi:sugar lactone lactonase YvrE
MKVARGFPKIATLNAVILLCLSFKARADSGNIFAASINQSGPSQIYEITTGGSKSIFTYLSDPFGLAFNSSGDLFAGDEGGGYIFEYAPNGSQTTFATGLNTPLGLAFAPNGNLFVANAVFSGTGSIFEYAPNGNRITFATGLGTPVGLAFSSSSNLFVADAGSGNIYEYAPNGSRSIFASGLSPNSLVFNANGDLFESDESGNIYEFAPNGSRSTFVSGLAANSLVGLIFDSSGDLFVSNISSGDIDEFAPNGSESIFATGLNNPTGLAFEPTPEPSSWILMLISGGFFFSRRPVRPDRQTAMRFCSFQKF